MGPLTHDPLTHDPLTHDPLTHDLVSHDPLTQDKIVVRKTSYFFKAKVTQKSKMAAMHHAPEKDIVSNSCAKMATKVSI